MTWIDWLIVTACVALLFVIAKMAGSLNHSVAGYLAADRMAGRYLLSVASGMSSFGAISIVANFEKYYQSGFGGVWWGMMLSPISLLLALSGFVIYRFRETRAFTMAQFFEMRYSRRFRVFAGILAWVSGLLNYGIFPAISARFLIAFTGLPERFHVGVFTVPTLPLVMLVLLATALTLTLSGGQISVMISDFLQGQFVNIVCIAILASVFLKVSWGEMMMALRESPPGQSRLNPFDQASIPDFNVWFFMISAFLQVYGHKAWQGSQGYNSAPKSPHEARMAGILGEFRGCINYLIILLLPICVYAMLHLPEYAETSRTVDAALAAMSDPQAEKQMRVPVALGELLPVGLLGLFTAVIIMAAVATDTTYLHSWGSIFIQDVVLPLRKKPLSPRAHILALRLSVAGVAFFAFWFSVFFPLNDYIFMYFQITGAIYLGGAGAVILGGLYWKRGQVEGAWAAMGGGSFLAVAGISLRNIVWPYVLPGLKENFPDVGWIVGLPEKFPLNGSQLAGGTAAAAILLYVIFSLLSRREPIDMEKLLKRGPHAVEREGHHPGSPVREGRKSRLYRRLGINGDFTTGDKAIYFFKIGWTMFWFVVFAVGCTLAAFWTIPTEWWERWWGFKVLLTLIVGLIATVWFLIGGFKDMFEMVDSLRKAKNEPAGDDGTVGKTEKLGAKD